MELILKLTTGRRRFKKELSSEMNSSNRSENCSRQANLRKLRGKRSCLPKINQSNKIKQHWKEIKHLNLCFQNMAGKKL